VVGYKVSLRAAGQDFETRQGKDIFFLSFFLSFPPKPFIEDLGPTQPPVKQVKLFMPASKAVGA